MNIIWQHGNLALKGGSFGQLDIAGQIGTFQKSVKKHPCVFLDKCQVDRFNEMAWANLELAKRPFKQGFKWKQLANAIFLDNLTVIITMIIGIN